MSGAIRHVIVDPAYGRRLYAAAENGGIWVLDDVDSPGVGWRPLSDGLENLQMRGLAKSRVRSGYIVTANALGYLYHSRNHGGTWARITDESFQYVRRILIAEGKIRIPAGKRGRLARETTLWVACQRGLYRLRLVNGQFDSMTKLFPEGAGEADVLDALLHPLNHRILYVGVRGEGVWSSTNGGGRWDPVAGWATFGDARSPMIKLAITATGSRVVAKMGRNVVLHDQGDDATDWAQTADVSWDDNDIGGNDIGYRGNYSTVKGEWCHAVAIHPSNPNVIAVGQQRLFLSGDGGTSWTKVDSGHEDIQSLTFSPSGDRLYIANDGGVYCRKIETDDLTAGPTTDLNTNLVTMQFYRVGVQGDTAVGPADHMGIRGTTNLSDDIPYWQRATLSASGYGNNGLENNFVTADPRTEGRFFVQFGEDKALLRLRYPGTGSTDDLLVFNDPGTPLQTFTAITNNNAVFNQLNYAVNTVAVDPTPGSSIILASVHEVPNAQFGVWMTRDGGADPSGGPRRTCGENVGEEGWTPRRAGDITVWDEFECNAATEGSVFYGAPVLDTSVWEPMSLTGLPAPVVSIIFSPRKPGKAFALEESGAVWAKDEIGDEGEDWRQLGAWAVGAGDYARQIIADTVLPRWSLWRGRRVERLYAISHRKFVQSRNGGEVWTDTGGSTIPDDQQLNSICAHPGSRGVLYLATSRDVLITRNRGRSWASIGKRLPNAPVMQVFTESGYLYAVTFGRGLWRMRLHGRPCRNR